MFFPWILRCPSRFRTLDPAACLRDSLDSLSLPVISSRRANTSRARVWVNDQFGSKVAIENCHLWWIYPLNMVIFHSHVKLSEGIWDIFWTVRMFNFISICRCLCLPGISSSTRCSSEFAACSSLDHPTG